MSRAHATKSSVPEPAPGRYGKQEYGDSIALTYRVHAKDQLMLMWCFNTGINSSNRLQNQTVQANMEIFGNSGRFKFFPPLELGNDSTSQRL